MSRAPMPKKVVEKKSFSKKQSLYSQLLCAYKELPSEIADLDDFVAELERNSCILFFRGALKRGNPARFTSDYTPITPNKPINRILKLLNAKESYVAAKNELIRRFPGQEYSVQIEILDTFFSLCKVTARQAIILMDENNIWDDIYCLRVLDELLNDKAISKSAKKAGEKLLFDMASKQAITDNIEIARRVLPYYYFCMHHFENEVDTSRMKPLEYVEYYFFVHEHITKDKCLSLLYGLIENEINQKRYTNIANKSSWLPSIVSLFSVQRFLELAAKYNKTECIKWVYALDRAIQTDIVDDPRWSEYAQTEIDLRDNDSIERAMDIFYAYVLSFIKSRERQL